jgi:acyl transferase domain-containing protein
MRSKRLLWQPCLESTEIHGILCAWDLSRRISDTWREAVAWQASSRQSSCSSGVLCLGLLTLRMPIRRSRPKRGTSRSVRASKSQRLSLMCLQLPVENVLWPSGLRRASVNSFGFGGSNAHVVIEDAYHHLRHRGLHGNHSTQVRPALHASEHNPSTTVSEEAYLGEECRPQAQNNLGASGARLLVLSAVDESGATRIAKAYSEHINCISDLDPNSAQVYLNNLAYTLTVRRTHLPWRSFMIACQLSDARGMEMKISKAVRSSNKPQLGFVFTGQGAQYAQMGLELFPLAGFRASLESCRRYLQSFGCAWDLFGMICLFDVPRPN